MITSHPVIDVAEETHRRFWSRAHLARCVRALHEEQAELTIELSKFFREESGEISAATPEGRRRIERIMAELADVCVCLEFIGRKFHMSARDLQALMVDAATKMDRKLVQLERIGTAASFPDRAYTPQDL